MSEYIQLQSGSVIETERLDHWQSDLNEGKAKRLSKAKGKELLKQEAFKYLHKILKPGDTVHCVLRHVSSSGMYRRISFFAIGKDRQPLCLDGSIIRLGVGDRPRGDNQGVGVGGCGMDMGFAVVSNLGSAMWPKGTTKPHGTRNGEPDSDGGYALKCRWM